MVPLKMGIIGWFYMPYFKPTIDFNMLQYIKSSDSQVSVKTIDLMGSNDLQARLIMDFKNHIILERFKHITHAIFYYYIYAYI